MKRSDRAYDSVGQTEPYFGVISLDRYLSANLDAAALSEFFASGEAQVAQVLAMIRARFAADFKPRRALDFGCGVGRILIPLAREADHAIGVDVSDAMMAEAARNCRERGLANVSFVKSDDRLSRLEGTFDLIHSSIVFQHIVPRRRRRAALHDLAAVAQTDNPRAQEGAAAGEDRSESLSPQGLVLRLDRAELLHPGSHNGRAG